MALFLLFLLGQSVWVFHNPDVLAFDSTAALFLFLFPFIILTVLAFISLEMRFAPPKARNRKKPPIHMKNRIIPWRFKLYAWLILVPIIVFPTMIGFFDRYELSRHSVIKYNGFNQVSFQKDLSALSSATIGVRRVSNRGSTKNFELYIELRFGGQVLVFSRFKNQNSIFRILAELRRNSVALNTAGKDLLSRYTSGSEFTSLDKEQQQTLLRLFATMQAQVRPSW